VAKKKSPKKQACRGPPHSKKDLKKRKTAKEGSEMRSFKTKRNHTRKTEIGDGRPKGRVGKQNKEIEINKKNGEGRRI